MDLATDVSANKIKYVQKECRAHTSTCRVFNDFEWDRRENNSCLHKIYCGKQGSTWLGKVTSSPGCSPR